MTSNKFSLGDVVRMRMGGPRMTVESIQFPNSTNLRTTEVIRCVWFDENNHVQRDAFDDFALERLPQP